MMERNIYADLPEALSHFEYGHLPVDLQEYSRKCREVAYWMAENLQDSPQLRFGLQDLLRAKDCFVRAMVASREERNV
jgi:hypothetical protein